MNLGQTRFSFIRDAIPVLVGRAGLGRDNVCIMLHGSLFMHWARGSLDSRFFTFLLGNAGVITVLGETHRGRLITLGIPRERVQVVVNSCRAEVLTAESVRAKHNPESCASRPLRLLYLSSLIDTKGYPEYLEAVRRLSTWGGLTIDAVICGRISPSGYSEGLGDPAAAEKWIDGQIAAINRSPKSSARWVRGAVGLEKATLLSEADVFVLPTRYPVEAQPVALLEAMASGCAIVTTRAGEITTILNEECAVLLTGASVDAVEEALQILSTNPERRLRLATAAHKRFVDLYGIERHIDRWEGLLRAPRATDGDAP